MTEKTENAGGQKPVHVPVLPALVLEALTPEQGAAELSGWVVDGTLGAGEHTARILDHFPGVCVFGIDQDPDILAHAKQRLATYGSRVSLHHGRVSDLAEIWDDAAEERGGNPQQLVGMLLDLGASSLQLDTADRGFSFLQDGPLDMRMDPRRERTAADIVNTWDESDLADLFFHEGDERHSRALARAICEDRRRVPFRRTLALADLCERVLGRGGRNHPGTKAFQALRRAVNEEADELDGGLEFAEAQLVNDGRLVVISFHSGEDRRVKHFLADGMRAGSWDVLTKKPRKADRAELRVNRRSRSAVLRAAMRTRAAETDGEGAQ